MAKYTTEVRSICESLAGEKSPVGYKSIYRIIAESRGEIFDFDYPCFDPQYKPVLETKILKHYYTREICEETYGLWKLRLDSRLNEIMPYYNQLYESTLISFNPLLDVDLTTQHNESNTDVTNNQFDENSNLNRNASNRLNENVDEFKNKNGNNNNEKIVDESTSKTRDMTNEISENMDEIKNKSGANETNGTGSETNNLTEKGNDNIEKIGNQSTIAETKNISNVTNNTYEEDIDERVQNNSGVIFNDETSHDERDETRSSDYNGENNRIENSERTSEKVDNNTNWDLFSDTPQGGIDGFGNNADAPTGLEDKLYLTTARKVTDNGNEKVNDSENNYENSNEINRTVDDINTSEDGSNSTKNNSDEINISNDSSFRTTRENGNNTTNNTENNENNYVENTSGSSDKNINEVNSNTQTNSENYNEVNVNNQITNKKEERSDTEEGSNLKSEKNDENYNEINVNNMGRNLDSAEDVSENLGRIKTETKIRNNTEEYIQRISGKSGGNSYSALLQEFRDTFINIDEMIIEELSDLFFGLW